MRLPNTIYSFISIYFTFAITSKFSSSFALQKRWALLNITTLITDPVENITRMNNILLSDSALYSSNSPNKVVSAELIPVFSRVINSNDIPDNIELANITNPFGCTNYINENLPENYIALVSRGECTFEKKVQVALACKASAIIIYNNELDVIIMFIKS